MIIIITTLIIVIIIVISGSSSRSIIIIISTIFNIITSTSSPLSLSSSLQNHFHHHHHHRCRHRYYTCLAEKHVEKEVEYMPDSVGHHCHFISQSTKRSNLKKGSILICKKLLHSRNYIHVLTAMITAQYMYFDY